MLNDCLSMQHAACYTLNTASWTLHAAPCMLNMLRLAAHCTLHVTARCILQAACHGSLHIARCVSRIAAHCTLHVTARCILHDVCHGPLHIARCISRLAAHCTLQVARFITSFSFSFCFASSSITWFELCWNINSLPLPIYNDNAKIS